MDEARRADDYRRANQIALDDVAVLPLAYPTAAYLVKPTIQGYQTNLLGLIPHQTTMKH
jgi:ABC-type oligopeptide transport system substrate-binding subunit